MTHIYVIRCGNLLKIGHSRNPEKRLVAIQGGSPKEMRLILTRQVPRDKARRIEMNIHYRLANDCVGGEWFKSTVANAKSAISRCIEAAVPTPRPSREYADIYYEAIFGGRPPNRKTCIATDKKWLRKRERVLA